MLPVFKLEYKSFIRGPGPIFLFGFPLLTVSIFGPLQPLKDIIPATIGLNIVMVSMLSFGLDFVWKKNTSITKMIGSLSISKNKYLIYIITFNLFIIIISILWLFTIAALFSFIPNFLIIDATYIDSGAISIDSENFIIINDTKNFAFVNPSNPLEGIIDINTNSIIEDYNAINPYSNYSLDYVQWPIFIFSIFASSIMSLSIALFIALTFKSYQSYGQMSLTYILIFGSILSGVFIPMNKIEESWLNYLTFLSPVSYGNNLITYSFQGGVGTNIMVLQTNWINDVSELNTQGIRNILSTFIPVLLSFSFGLISYKKFKWTT